MRTSNTKYITLISTCACMAVVAIHSNVMFSTLDNVDLTGMDLSWKTGLLIHFLLYCAVPLFFMITGATLMEYSDRYTTKEYFKKRIKKAVIPFLFWSFFKAFVWFPFLDSQGFTNISLSAILENIFYSHSEYWFFRPLFMVYLTIPIFSAIPKEKRKKILSYVLLVCLFFSWIIPFFKSAVYYFNYSSEFVVGCSYFVYAIVGYLLKEKEISKKQEVIIYIISLGAFVIQYGGTLMLSLRSGGLVNGIYMGYENIMCFTYSVGVFVFFKKYGNRIMESKIGGIVKFLSKFTFGVYLTHIYIINILEKYFLSSILEANFEGMFLPKLAMGILISFSISVVAFFVSVLIVALLRKIPVVKNIVP